MPEPQKESKLISWLKKIGILGFLFFLLKGIAWLLVFFGVFQFTNC
jgi:hypothetical protein